MHRRKSARRPAPAHHDRGQQGAAGALLKLLGSSAAGACVVGLPQLVVSGGGDACLGAVSLVREALRRRAHAPQSAVAAAETCMG